MTCHHQAWLVLIHLKIFSEVKISLCLHDYSFLFPCYFQKRSHAPSRAACPTLKRKSFDLEDSADSEYVPNQVCKLIYIDRMDGCYVIETIPTMIINLLIIYIILQDKKSCKLEASSPRQYMSPFRKPLAILSVNRSSPSSDGSPHVNIWHYNFLTFVKIIWWWKINFMYILFIYLSMYYFWWLKYD